MKAETAAKKIEKNNKLSDKIIKNKLVMKKALVRTDYISQGQKSVYHGKVRDVYNINDEVLVMVATDRISAFRRSIAGRYSLQRPDVEPDCSQIP